MVFVTGGTGLVGAHLLFFLCTENTAVRALRRASSDVSNVKRTFQYLGDFELKLYNKIEWVEGDVLDIFSLSDALKDIHAVYHAAAEISFNDSSSEMMKVNIEGTANLVDLLIENKKAKLCYISSIAALGRDEVTGEVSEELHWKSSKDLSSYSISKYRAEMEVWRGIEEGLEAVIVNPSIVLGPTFFNRSSTQIFNAISKTGPFFPSGSSAFVDVRDVAEGAIKLMQSKACSERFVLSSENLSYKELFNMVRKQQSKPGVKLPIASWMIRGIQLTDAVLKLVGKTANYKAVRSASKKLRVNTSNLSKFISFEYRPIEQSLKDFI